MSEGIKAARARGDYDSVSEAMKAARARGSHDGMFTEETRHKMSESMKAAWERGDFDGAYTEETRRKNSDGVKAAWARGAMDSEETRRKKSEASKAARARGSHDGEETRSKQSEGMKAAWARGDWDGVFLSPSKPELAIAQALDDLGIEYETQYRLDGDGRPFDFYLPPDTLLEIDGVYWHSRPGQAARDAAKSALAKKRSYRLIRITDLEIAEHGARAILAERDWQ